MIIEFPKAIYNNTDKVTTTVNSKDAENIVVGYFKDELDHDCIPYTKLPESEALRIHGEAKAEVEKVIESQEKKEEEKKEEEKEQTEQAVNLQSLSYLEIVTYAKQVMRETGVKFPVRATRESIEKSIREAIDGDNNKRPS